MVVLDASRFETSSEYSSLWSILDISETVVANTVIDQMQVESILLIPTSQEAGKLLKDKSLVPKNCKCAYTLNLDQYYPDPNYRVYSGRGSHRARFLQVSVEDKIRDITKNKEECTERLNLLVTHDIKESLAELKDLQEKMKVSSSKIQGYKKELGSLRMTLAELQNQETTPPPDVTQLEEEVKQLEAKMGNAKAKMEEIRKSSLEKKQEFNNFSATLMDLRQKEKHAYSEVEKWKGSVSISIEEEALNIHVEKPGVHYTSPVKIQLTSKELKKSKTHQDLIMMSGGERSYATVAFIIALWHAIVSPVRILDEFDVFMKDLTALVQGVL
ncbi:Structural maintenance of chromosomes protein 6 [Portunus trituberculatus]|uniref:Structural maintenance of chromosomes protein 6 n=1 Tax=Portunus trituberculatus TaxID=210409 RepID=A0A5B7D9L3_PORTR|nr:Structural maintenance of chromosomes protein 6 [Portunus trituberculatus]